jgi:hypothetical protein
MSAEQRERVDRAIAKFRATTGICAAANNAAEEAAAAQEESATLAELEETEAWVESATFAELYALAVVPDTRRAQLFGGLIRSAFYKRRQLAKLGEEAVEEEEAAAYVLRLIRLVRSLAL